MEPGSAALDVDALTTKPTRRYSETARREAGVQGTDKT